jgi:S1-C subfamily serine protease
LSFDGHALRHPVDLVGLLEPEKVGSEVEVKLVRAGEAKTARLLVGTRAA